MLKILKHLTKGSWKQTSPPQKSKKKSRKKKTPRKSREELLESFIKKTWKEIIKNGSKSVRVSALMKSIGVAKRSLKTVDLINSEFSNSGLYVQPEISMNTGWNELLRITDYPEKPLGDLFEDEGSLEEYIDKNGLYKKLGIDDVDRQHSPMRTKDRLDFLGFSEDALVILELKNWGGGKSAVEQVLRYSGYKKKEAKDESINIRKILVTGIANKETAMAFRGMRPSERENFEWYLYKYNQQSGELDFVRVTEEEINDKLTG